MPGIMAATTAVPLEETLVIVGVGLIGGSIAAAARRRGLARQIIGVGRNPERLEQARQAGFLDAVVTDPATAGPNAFIVFCTPVNHIAAAVERILPRLPAGAIITDAGSTKRRMCEALADWAGRDPTFLGSHPIAGSEKQGFEHADPELFAGRTCVITPLSGHRPADITRVRRFWAGLGMTVVSLSPAEHDQALASTSHVPHVVAAALADSLSESDRRLTGTGFASTTRIAAGDPDLWTAILCENAGPVADGLLRLQARLGDFERALRAGDVPALKSLLQTAKTKRDALDG